MNESSRAHPAALGSARATIIHSILVVGAEGMAEQEAAVEMGTGGGAMEAGAAVEVALEQAADAEESVAVEQAADAEESVAVEAEPEPAAAPGPADDDSAAALEAVMLERDQLRAAKEEQDTTIVRLQAEAEADKRTIEELTAQVTKLSKELMDRAEEGVPPEGGAESSEDEIDESLSTGPGAAGGAAGGGDDDDGPSQADVAKRSMIEEMFVSGKITEMEYDEMVERMEREREATEHVAAEKAAWQDVLTAFNKQSCKKGVAKMELEWNSLGIEEPYSAAAVARVFRKHAGSGKEHLARGEIGEFLAGSKPFMVEVRDAYTDLYDFSGMSFVSSLVSNFIVIQHVEESSSG
jgi:hypothetical protein